MNSAHLFVGLIVLVFLSQQAFDLNQFILFKDENFRFYQLFTSSFLHGNFQHLLFNSIALLQVGIFMFRETFLDFSLKWIIFALGASGFSLFLETNPVLGASGVVMGFFTYSYLTYKNEFDMRPLYFLIVINILIGFLPGISFWGHFGGALIGVFYFYFERVLNKN